MSKIMKQLPFRVYLVQVNALPSRMQYTNVQPRYWKVGLENISSWKAFEKELH